MILPISTDAPIYHFPFATLALIAANVATFALTAGGHPDSWDAWMLTYGNGLHPLEWVSCNFLHFGFMHLIGNMVFLWGFGLVVEGKLGWWRFLLVYFGIGIVHALVEQAIMLGYIGEIRGSGGASGVLFGLLAMALVWAPKNEMTCFAMLGIRFFTFEVTILMFAVGYIALQIAFASLHGFAMSSEVIHLLGAAAGFGLGIGMLHLDWVDCEGWDLFAVMNGTVGQPRQRRRKKKKPASSPDPSSKPAAKPRATVDPEKRRPAPQRRLRPLKPLETDDE